MKTLSNETFDISKSKHFAIANDLKKIINHSLGEVEFGDNHKALFKYLLKDSSLHDDYLDAKLQPIVNGLHELHSSLMNQHYLKPQVTSIITTIISQKSLRDKYGWSISNDAFVTGNRHAAIHGPGKKPPMPLAWSKRALDPADRADLERWLMSHSYAASSRWVKIKTEYVGVQYLDNTVKQLHDLWKQDSNHRQMSYTSFRKTIKKLKKFKDPRQRGTDLSDNCIHGKSVEKQLKRSISQHASHCLGRHLDRD